MASAAGVTAWWRNVRVLRAVFQLAFVVGLGLLVAYLAANLLSNMRAQGLRTDYGFLDRPAGVRIAGADFRSSQPVREALLVGAKNTLLVSLVGIVMASVLGVVVGVARLSTNWLVARVAAFYVESLRNIPVLVIIVFWSAAVILKLPTIDEAVVWLGGVVLSNRGLWIPWFEPGEGMGAYWVVLGAGLVAAAGFVRRRTRAFEATGKPHHRVLWGTATFSVFAMAGYVLLGSPFTISVPELTGRRVIDGTAVSPEYAALLLGLVVYTASHIAEIVRGSILAVPKGQIEAATAVALSPTQRLRLVVLPQAFRVALPPLANQYLNLTKNSSLGIAVAYAELTALTFILIASGNPAPQAISIMMLVYLAFSLTISVVTNLVNRRLAVGR